MSTLASKVDVLRGWPNGQAIEDSFTVDTGVTLYEGRIAMLKASGNNPVVGEASTAAATLFGADAAGTPVTGLYFVITGNDANTYDGVFTGKAVVLRGPMTIQTDQLGEAVANFEPGERVKWQHTGAGEIGKFLVAGATDQSIGVVEKTDEVNGTIIVQLSL